MRAEGGGDGNSGGPAAPSRGASTSPEGPAGAMPEALAPERVIGRGEGRALAEESLREADSEDTALMLSSSHTMGIPTGLL